MPKSSWVRMTEEAKIYQLIVQQGAPSNAVLDDLLQILMGDFGLDAYTARIRLIGSGKALFGSGRRDKTARLAGVLRGHGFDCWVVHRSEENSQPFRMRQLRISAEAVEFVGRDTALSLPRGSHVVAVLADISGKLEERSLQRHAMQRAYKDARHVTAMAEDKMVQSVLKGRPVLDLYVLGAQGALCNAVRVFPGRFDAKGLGERMTLSAVRNLEAIVLLASEYAGSFSLHADFGLGRLPGCQIKSLDGASLAEEDVLKRLTRYGWLMCDLEQDVPEDVPEEIDPALAAFAVASGQPALAAAMASGGAEMVPGFGEVIKEFKEASAGADEKAVKTPVEEWLSSPPERPASKLSLSLVLSVVGPVLLGLLFVVFDVRNLHLFRVAGKYAMKAGVFPALVAMGLFGVGFYFVRLKRNIENTPTSRIRSIAMGMVEIHGRAIRKYALVSPVSQSPCIYYRVRKYKKDSRNQWKLTSDINSSHVPFLVDDGSGKVTVDPCRATVRAKTSHSGVPGETTLALHGVSVDNVNEKWVENIIYEGTTLYVLGFARPLREKRKGLRERTIEKLRELKLDRQALHRYDADGDGQISDGEWDVARGDAEQMALEEHLAESSGARRQEEHVVISRAAQRGLPFVVAEAQSEALLVRNYGLISLPLFVAGLCAAGLALYGFLSFIGV